VTYVILADYGPPGYAPAFRDAAAYLSFVAEDLDAADVGYRVVWKLAG